MTTAERARISSAWISLILSIVVLAIKTGGYFLTGSSAVLSDALESIVNVVTAGVALGILRFSSQPADENHPYGHGKAEYVSASFEGGLIVFAAVMIFIESARALARGVDVRQLDLGFAALFVATVINFFLARHLRKVGNQFRSEALRASSSHVMSDVKTTIGVGLGLLLVQATGWLWLDPILAMLVAMNLAWEGSQIVRRSFGGLVDEIDIESIKSLAEILERYRAPAIIDIHHVRSIRSGHFHHIDATIVVPEYWDIKRIDELTHQYEKQVVNDYPYDAEIAIHLDACLRAFCSECAVMECPVRLAPFQKIRTLTLSRLIADTASSKD